MAIAIASISKINKEMKLQIAKQEEYEVIKEVELHKSRKRSLEAKAFQKKREEMARLEKEKVNYDVAINTNITPTRSGSREFIATAYDLTVQSCGKKESHPSYGITANGTSLKGHTLDSARAIAVDPKIIKLGSKVHIEFLDDEYKHLDGIFTAVDTGGAIKGKKIDIFFGDTGDKKTDQSVWDFGKRKVRIRLIND